MGFFGCGLHQTPNYIEKFQFLISGCTHTMSKNTSLLFSNQTLLFICTHYTAVGRYGVVIFFSNFDDPTLFLKAVVYNCSFCCVSHELLLKVEFIGYDLPDPGLLSPMSLWLIYFRRRYCCD